MITFRLTRVEDERSLVSFLDRLAQEYRVKVGYMRPCLARTYQVCVDGPNESRFEVELLAHAPEAGWEVNR